VKFISAESPKTHLKRSEEKARQTWSEENKTNMVGAEMDL
jgi:hypothetical protein